MRLEGHEASDSTRSVIFIPFGPAPELPLLAGMLLLVAEFTRVLLFGCVLLAGAAAVLALDAWLFASGGLVGLEDMDRKIVNS